MKTKQKIPAFTIAEMLVVLVVSAIVISLAMMVLSLVQKQIHTIKQTTEKTNEILLLEKVLWNDINTKKLHYNKEKELLTAYTILDTVKYQFAEEYILRNKDTLKVGVSQVIPYLTGDISQSNDLDAVELTLTKDYLNKKLFIFTQKDVSYFMNDKTNQ